MDLSLSGSQISPNRRNRAQRRPTSANSSRLSSSLKTKHLKTQENEGNQRKIKSATPRSRIGNKNNNSNNQSNHFKSSFSGSMAIRFPEKEPTKVLSSRSTKDYLALFEEDRDFINNLELSLDTDTSFSNSRLSSASIPAVKDSMRTENIQNNTETLAMPTLNNDAKPEIEIDKENAAPLIVKKTSNIESHRTGSEDASVPKINHKNKRKNAENLKARENSAVKIQKWYRRHFQRKKASNAALKRMLSAKKESLESSIIEEKTKERQLLRTEEEKKRKREQRAKEARQKAIEELKKSREIKQREENEFVQKELKEIEARQKKRNSARSNKISPRKSEQDLPTTTSRSEDEKKEEKIVQSVEARIERLFEETNPNSTEYEEIKKEEDIKSSKANQSLLSTLLETIEQLEAEPEELVKGDAKRFDEKLSWIDEMQSDHLSNLSHQSKNSKNFSTGPSGDTANQVVDENILLTKAKMDNIMDFLDKVEKQDIEYESSKSQVSSSLTSEMATKKFVETEKAASEIASELLKLRLDVDEKNRSIELLKKAVSQQKELSLRHIKSQDTEMEQRLKMQKDQYESTIQRHLAFINQLIDDKKELNQKCQKMVEEMKNAEAKYQNKIKHLEEGHNVELKKIKEVQSAVEKLRREKWINEKTKTIKEMTVKGLEPEIQRLLGKHKQEIKKIKAIHEAELMQADERAAQRYIRQTEELREQLEKEKEDACCRERELVRQRFEKQLEHEEMALQQQRRRMYAEISEEKERLNQQAMRQRKDTEETKLQMEDGNRRAIAALTEEYNKSKEEADRRHKEELEALKDRLELEKQAWQENYMKKQENFILQKERQFKEAIRKDRDGEIETVIEQLEKDMQQQKDQIEKTSENRIKRIREKYEMELKEVEKLERQTQEKYNIAKAKFTEIEGENMRMQSLVKQKDQELLDIRKIKEKLVEERGNIQEVIRDEFAERLVYTEEENKRMKNEVSQMRTRHRLEVERITKEKEDELSEVHKRVKAAIVKKEEAITQMKQQYDAAMKRSDHLEELLETQRKQLLSIKKK